jgi:outer membrane receptor protein involved in Fe transport
MQKHIRQVSWLNGCAVASLFIALSSTPVAAETAPADAAPPAAEAAGVGDIVVTARKKQESSNAVGMSINAITGDTLAQQGIMNTADLVKAVPGFNYTRSTYGTPVFTLRGIGFNETTLAAAPPVSVYVDEVPLPYSIMTQGVALDVQRVEVLKGPQGTLFGQNSTGGAINYIAAKPTKTLEAGADASFGRFDSFNGSAFLSGPLTDNLRGRIAVRRIERPLATERHPPRRPHRRYRPHPGAHPARLGCQQQADLRTQCQWLARPLHPQAGQYVGLTSTKAPPSSPIPPPQPAMRRPQTGTRTPISTHMTAFSSWPCAPITNWAAT